ncbi:Asp23/Gls24 family envelope stress response protein [Chloroflexota bacterium]
MEETIGKVTIAPNVLVTIVQKAADSVPGVAELCENAPGVKRLLGRHVASRGVEVDVVEDQVVVDVHLIARRGVDLLQMGRTLQYDVTRAIEDIVGMDISEVNVHIEDVATELPEDKGPGKKG